MLKKIAAAISLLGIFFCSAIQILNILECQTKFLESAKYVLSGFLALQFCHLLILAIEFFCKKKLMLGCTFFSELVFHLSILGLLAFQLLQICKPAWSVSVSLYYLVAFAVVSTAMAIEGNYKKKHISNETDIAPPQDRG